ncbi:nicotinate-nucleotide--dimethylbenzimidazole phosphoribosyltransferase [Acinetobacter sp. WU_MDCI_Axc73]|nr:nicotinate-nucleotide--dimethylbenzimidazole phosphoribosyltransferase [Acinetobacter sp. WU_MDCI_Axc73]
MSWFIEPVKVIDEQAKQSAIQRQQQLTKPTGSLGDLELIAIQLAALQGTPHPHLNQPWITIFAGDHGVMQENISAYPQAVTRQMLQNFTTGGACISVIARHYAANLQVIDCGTVGESYCYEGVETHYIGAGTANFAIEAAMTEAQCHQAMKLGRDSAQKAISAKADIFVAGEMGIGNTCSASALACLLLNEDADQLTGAGTGIDAQKLKHKKQVIDQAIALHHPHVKDDPFKIMTAVGGLEIAAMTGAYIHCAQLGMPMVIDGFISSVAALCVVRLNPLVRHWMLFGHQSAEYGHRRVLAELNAKPILNLNLRLGEGSGAGAALGVIQLACALHNQMATFSEASVSGDQV